MSQNGFAMFRTIGCLVAFASCVLASGSSAQLAVVEAQSRDGQHLKMIGPQSIVVSEVKDGKSQTVEIRIVDGKATVIRDGKELSDVQIIEKDDGVVITDQDGKQLHELKLHLKGDGRGFYFGDGHFRSFHLNDQDAAGHWKGFINAAAPTVMLGVNMSAPGPALEKHLKLEPNTTTLLSGVYEGLPAHDAGLDVYDVIVKVDGHSPADNESIRKVLSERKPGDTIAFTVIQEGEHKEVTVTLKAFDASAMAKAELLGNASNNPLQGWIGADGNPDILQWQGEFPRVFFAPERYKAEIGKFTPQFEKLRDYAVAAAPKVQADIEQQLQRLDERMAELEKLMQQLVERRESNR